MLEKKLIFLKKKKRKLFFFKTLLLIFYFKIKKQKKVFLINILELFVYFFLFLFKLFFFKLWKKFEFHFYSETIKNTKKLKDSESVLKLFSISIYDLSRRKFSMFNFFFFFKNHDYIYLNNLKHFFRFLYKFSVYRELSFTCQSFFNKLYFLNYKDLYFINSKNILKVSWDLNLMLYIKNCIYFSTLKQQKSLFSYILLSSYKFLIFKINIKRFIKSLSFLIFLHNTVFSFGNIKSNGEIYFINFVLYLRRSYLSNFKCVKNLVWVSLRSNKNFKISYLWSYLSCFKRLNFNSFLLNFFCNVENFYKLKNYFLEYFKFGLYHKLCRVRFSDWYKQLYYLFFNRLLMPSIIKNKFENFMNSFIFFLLYYIIFSLNFFYLLYRIFSVLKLRFNFYGMPGLFSIKTMIYKLRPQKKLFLIKKGFWFNDTGIYLKNKYKNFKVWSLWKNYNFFFKKFNDLTLKNFLKSNSVFFNYYLVFFKKFPNLKKKRNVLNVFNLLETRLDILLYRLGYSQNMYYLRLYIKTGRFLVNYMTIKYISYYIVPNDLVQSSIKFINNFYNKIHKFILYKLRNKQKRSFWFQSKIFYYRFVEFEFLKLAFILIRFPKYGEINFMSNDFIKFTKKRFPVFENVKSKHYIFSKTKYFKIFGLF